MFRFAGLFPSQIQRSSLCRSTVVCGSLTSLYPTVFKGENTRTADTAWIQFDHAAWICDQRHTSNRIGRRNAVHQSVGLGPHTARVQPNFTEKSTKLQTDTVDRLFTGAKGIFQRMSINYWLVHSNYGNLFSSLCDDIMIYIHRGSLFFLF